MTLSLAPFLFEFDPVINFQTGVMTIKPQALALASVSLADLGSSPPSTQPSLAPSTVFSDDSSNPRQFSHADPAVNALIQRFAHTVFRDALPQKLPPVRNLFHQINLPPPLTIHRHSDPPIAYHLQSRPSFRNN
jgi:hypothetical protein